MLTVAIRYANECTEVQTCVAMVPRGSPGFAQLIA